ncbi:hypothetical protein O7599_16945 [Streptomyces sp. WMMC500]|uniref:hypothetical protein n=1 Tax=Streptomyces sp. WMMC500 TaxID=3015154 RepID=UPI00248BF3B9|nr:hypothetical protein [Streptomyces sp. WMMC500]WBB64096.1 hypothetical protein O7599_16945 [Streptomyces sp. WMMC500]
MEMTEAFAATVAAVAPVIVLVGAVELAVYERLARTAMGEVRDFFDRVERGDVPSDEEGHRAAVINWVISAGRSIWPISLGLLWLSIMGTLCVIEFLALLALADPGRGDPEATAKLCLTGLTVGIVWVALVPAVRLFVGPLTPFAAVWLRKRLAEHLARTGALPGGESAPQEVSPGRAGSRSAGT